MSRPTVFLSVVGAALLTAITATPVNAIPFDNLTHITFSGPVQIPGATLEPGTYRFHLANPDTGRNVLQVLSNDGAIVYSMFHTIPDFRTVVTDEATVTFREAPAGVAPPVKSLFYGGETHGYEFVYGRGEPNMMPMATMLGSQPPPLYTPNPAPVVSPEPIAAEPVVSTPVMTEPAPEPTVEPASEPALPRTASPLPFAALGGFASLLGGIALRLRRRH